ncbi:uncharacterized protein LODBEIA_P35510 [Lodderomyces beijingensis]|uniref:NuA3 HAT complex component NTO1 n=1 Tax=Lodderomyces beijingensis TaxID=1775926 RepID=A0ABP0ZMG0_9ASCO
MEERSAQASLGYVVSAEKPREELELGELYPDLDETAALPVFFVNENTDDNYNSSNNGNSQKPSSEVLNLKVPTFRKIQPKLPNPNIRFNKQLFEYGFQEPSKAYSKVIQDTYVRPFQLPSSRSNQSGNSQQEVEQFLESKQMLVEYDMDEQDFLFLQDRNKNSSNVIKITPEIFEILISTLESEWKKLEHRINSLGGDNASSNSTGNGTGTGLDASKTVLTMAHNNEKYGNDDGIEPGSIYDQKCAVCYDSDCDNSNAIVFCDGCDIAVHQECYGVAFIPEGQWLCRKCMINKNKKNTTECVFCPSTTGAFKQLDNSLWSHVLCALWINELYFANPVYMEPIEGIDAIPKSRWKLNCYICKQRVGACIQCSNRNCFQAYHVTCAKRAGLYMDMTQGIKGALASKLTLKSFCEKHGPSSFDASSVPAGIEKTRRYFRDTKILNQQNARLSSDQKQANKLNVFKWKTEAGAPIAPKVFSDVLVGIMYKLKVENQISLPEESTNQVLGLSRLPNRTKLEIDQDLRSIANEMCRYWCLKRESKNGAPLVRKNNNLISSSSILYDSNNLENNGDNQAHVDEKLKFADLLVSDLDKLIAINQDALERQKLYKDIEQVNRDIVDTAYFPTKTLIASLLRLVNTKRDANGSILNFQPKNGTTTKSLAQIVDHNNHYGYDSVMQLQEDVDALSNCVFTQTKPSTNVYKQMRNWKRDFDKEMGKFAAIDDDSEPPPWAAAPTLQFPQLVLAGTKTYLEEPSYRRILEENDLSEVDADDEEVETEESKKLFERFLAGDATAD